MGAPGPRQPETCLPGGSQMGALMRAFDWSATPLGPIAGWPQSFKWDASARRFELVVFSETQLTAPHVLHVPLAGDGPMNWKVTCDGNAVNATPDAAGDLSISCNATGRHTIVVEGA